MLCSVVGVLAHLKRHRLFSAAAAIALITAPAAVGAGGDRIVGGSPAGPGEYPAQGLLVLDTNADGTAEGLCGGTLVGTRYFLTAAHCVTDDFGLPHSSSDLFVMLGDHDLRPPNTFSNVQIFERAVGYNPMTHQNDLAMLRLAGPALQEPMRVIRLDEAAKWAPGTQARIVGWGSTTEGGPPSDVLLEANVPIRADGDCGLYGSAFDPATMLCAAPPGGGTDTCEGDSGGPLMVDDGAGGLVLAGVTSWGNGCAQADYPGIYVRLGAPALNQWVMDRHPRASLSVPGQVHSRQPVTLTATSFFPPTSSATAFYRWDLDGDGNYAEGQGPGITWIFDSGGAISIGVRVSRGIDQVTARQTIRVNGTPTILAADRQYAVREGSQIRLRGSGADPEGQPVTFGWDFDGDETYETPGAAPLFSAARLDGPLDHVVGFRACDTVGGCATDTALVAILNVPPRVDGGRNRTVKRGRRLSFRIRIRDPGIRERFRVRWTCGNGVRGSGRTVRCRYRRIGLFAIRIAVTDGDEGRGTDVVRVRVRR